MTTRLCVAPEDVMALLDGELTGAEARAVKEHLEECSHCALLAKQLRETSESVERWSISSMSPVADKAVKERAEREASRLRKRTGMMRLAPWRIATAGAGVGILAMVALVTVSSMGLYRRARMVATPSETIAEETVADRPLQPAPPPPVPLSAMRMKKRSSAPPVAQNSNDGLAAYSNGTLANREVQENEFGTPAPTMIARVASLTLAIKDVDAARRSLEEIVSQHHGFAARMNVSAPEYGQHSLNASLKVPASELVATIAEMARLGRIVNESQSGEEVSQEHADLVARLKTARETEARFQAILQQRTGKVSDVLEVEQNIARVRGEIEAMEAEQKGLERRVEYSTIDVVLTQEYKAPLAAQTDSVSTQMHNALVAGYRNTTGMLLGMVLFVVEFGPPVLVGLAILAAPAYLLWRRYRRIRS